MFSKPLSPLSVYRDTDVTYGDLTCELLPLLPFKIQSYKMVSPFLSFEFLITYLLMGGTLLSSLQTRI